MYDDHVSLIASGSQVLALGMKGELRLIDALSPTYKVLGKLTVLEDESGIYATPRRGRQPALPARQRRRLLLLSGIVTPMSRSGFWRLYNFAGRCRRRNQCS